MANSKYQASVKVMGKVFTASGNTVYEAIENLKPGSVAGMMVLTVKHGEKNKDRVLPMVLGRRMFNTAGLTREAALKNASLLFDGI